VLTIHCIGLVFAATIPAFYNVHPLPSLLPQLSYLPQQHFVPSVAAVAGYGQR
jgi:hypothetical protein